LIFCLLFIGSLSVQKIKDWGNTWLDQTIWLTIDSFLLETRWEMGQNIPLFMDRMTDWKMLELNTIRTHLWKRDSGCYEHCCCAGALLSHHLRINCHIPIIFEKNPHMRLLTFKKSIFWGNWDPRSILFLNGQEKWSIKHLHYYIV